MKESIKKLGTPALPAVSLVVTALLMSALTSLATAQVPAPDPVTEDSPNKPVQIIFTGEPGEMCPVRVLPEASLEVSKEKNKVVWRAVNEQYEEISVQYEIYFDPFTGRPLRSFNDGSLTSPPFDKKTPVTTKGIEYKYTILGDDCPDKPLDPRITVRR
jgi:hypothetical protein